MIATACTSLNVQLLGVNATVYRLDKSFRLPSSLEYLLAGWLILQPMVHHPWLRPVADACSAANAYRKLISWTRARILGNMKREEVRTSRVMCNGWTIWIFFLYPLPPKYQSCSKLLMHKEGEIVGPWSSFDSLMSNTLMPYPIEMFLRRQIGMWLVKLRCIS